MNNTSNLIEFGCDFELTNYEIWDNQWVEEVREKTDSTTFDLMQTLRNQLASTKRRIENCI